MPRTSSQATRTALRTSSCATGGRRIAERPSGRFRQRRAVSAPEQPDLAEDPQCLAGGDRGGRSRRQRQGRGDCEASPAAACWRATTMPRLGGSCTILPPPASLAGDLDGNGKDELIADFRRDRPLCALQQCRAFVKLHTSPRKRLPSATSTATARTSFWSIAGHRPLGAAEQRRHMGQAALGLTVPYRDRRPRRQRQGRADRRDAWSPGCLDTLQQCRRVREEAGVGSAGLAIGDLDGNGKDEVLADFGATGLWAFYNNAPPWVKVDARNATNAHRRGSRQQRQSRDSWPISARPGFSRASTTPAPSASSALGPRRPLRLAISTDGDIQAAHCPPVTTKHAGPWELKPSDRRLEPSLEVRRSGERWYGEKR